MSSETTGHVDVVRHLAARGFSDAAIGRRTSRTEQAVRLIRNEHGIPAGYTVARALWRAQVRQVLDRGLSDREAAAVLNVGVSTVAYQRSCIRAEDLRQGLAS